MKNSTIGTNVAIETRPLWSIFKPPAMRVFVDFRILLYSMKNLNMLSILSLKKSYTEATMKRSLVLVVCLLAVFAVLVGCGQSKEEKAAEKIVEKIIERNSPGADVDFIKGNMNIKTEAGEMSININDSAKLPDNFPKDVFVMKSAEVKMTMDMPQGTSASFLSKEDMSSVFSKYQNEMTSKGWEQKMSMNLGEGATLVYEKDQRVANITMAKEEEGTIINLIINKK